MKKITDEQFVRQYSGLPESYLTVAQYAASECEEGSSLQVAGEKAIDSIRDFKDLLDHLGFEIG